MRVNRSVVGLAAVALVGVGKVEGAILWGGNGHWYEVFAVPEGITWTEASTAATALGGYLATITSQEESDFITALVGEESYWKVLGGKDVMGPWIGGFQPPGTFEPGGGWQWVTGEPFVFTNWGGSEPNNFLFEEDRIHLYTAEATWNDLADDYPDSYGAPISYIVEFDSPTVVPEPSTFAIWSLLGTLGITVGWWRRRRSAA